MDYTLQTLDQYKVNRPGATEVVRAPLYDYLIYPLAGTTQLTFFATPIGQGITSSFGTTAGSAKTYADTNMQLSGALPRPQSFLIESIEIVFEPGSVSSANTFTSANPAMFNSTAAAAVMAQVADVNLIRTSGWAELWIGSKTYVTMAPLGAFPAKTHLEIDAALASGGGTSAGGPLSGIANARASGRAFYLDPMIVLESLQNFAFYVKFPVATATTSGWNGRMGVIFDGVLYRLSQ